MSFGESGENILRTSGSFRRRGISIKQAWLHVGLFEYNHTVIKSKRKTYIMTVRSSLPFDDIKRIAMGMFYVGRFVEIWAEVARGVEPATSVDLIGKVTIATRKTPAHRLSHFTTPRPPRSTLYIPLHLEGTTIACTLHLSRLQTKIRLAHSVPMRMSC
jgi:hypothetical protein